MAQIAYIYALRDPRDRSIRYIGKANNPECRFKQHVISSNRIGRLASELASLGLSLQLQILQTCPNEVWPLWEKYWIALGFSLGEKLLNLRSGGENPPIQTGNAWIGRKHKPEARLKMSGAKLGKRPPNFGKKMSLEAREKNRIAQIGKTRSVETRRKMSAAHIGLNTWSRGRKCSMEHRAKVSSSIKEWWMKRKG